MARYVGSFLCKNTMLFQQSRIAFDRVEVKVRWRIFFRLQMNPHLIVSIPDNRSGANGFSLGFNWLKQLGLIVQMRIYQALDTHNT